jgi:hypothetical protein
MCFASARYLVPAYRYFKVMVRTGRGVFQKTGPMFVTEFKCYHKYVKSNQDWNSLHVQGLYTYVNNRRISNVQHEPIPRDN